MTKGQLLFVKVDRGLTSVFELLPKIHDRLGQNGCGRHGQQEQAHGCHGDAGCGKLWKNDSKEMNKGQFCRGRPQREETEGSPVCSAMQRGYSGQTPKRRRRGSPLGSEQMSESDWFAALSLS